MFEKYIVLNEAKIVCGQTNSGTWYCKELPANSVREMDLLINEVNCILNKYNASNHKNDVSKDSVKSVKGLK